MGNKDKGRAINNLPIDEYMRVMGGNVSEAKNTGIFPTNYEVYKYFKLLREYALNRIKWTSNVIDEEELRLIEWFIFHFGRCAMIRPKITRDNLKYQLSKPKIYQCTFLEENARNGQPEKISVVNAQNKHVIIDINYNKDEFVIFTDDYIFNNETQPFMYIAWEFACKLHELDLAFNSNSRKNRIPIVFNDGSTKADKDGITSLLNNSSISLAELFRSADGRGEQFVSVPEHMVGKDGFLHEPQYVKNDTAEHIETQKRLYEAYFELLGLYTNKERKGVYTVKDLQKDGDETGDYRTQILKNTRLLCAKKACKMFNIDLTLEVV